MDTTVVRPPSPVTRVLIALVVLLAFASGAGVVAAEDQTNDGHQCPGENPTEAYNHTSDTAVDQSAEGRQSALESSGCTD